MALTKTVSEMDALRRCSVVNWLEYFQFRVPSVVLPEGEAHRFVEVRTANYIIKILFGSLLQHKKSTACLVVCSAYSAHDDE